MWEYQGGGYLAGVPTRNLTPEEYELLRDLLKANLASPQPLYVWKDLPVQTAVVVEGDSNAELRTLPTEQDSNR